LGKTRHRNKPKCNIRFHLPPLSVRLTRLPSIPSW
jgi:hypothetical protein